MRTFVLNYDLIDNKIFTQLYREVFLWPSTSVTTLTFL